ncbi:MAG: efflux RND transporter periplasmic adaptor subunit [Proteobacteria bacterium]|nr:efflux RND transporter periplasmic adaptor subunit [Burkholderiales bacterium]
MNPKPVLFAIVAAAALGGAGYALYSAGMQRGMGMTASAPSPASPPGENAVTGGSMSAAAPSALPQSIAEGEEATRRHITAGIRAGDMDPATGAKILYYHDPMVPGNRFDQPAKSPFMDMMLVPVYAGGNADGSSVTVSPRIQQNLGVRTALVSEGTLAPQVNAVGSIAYNERDQALVQARATGYIERLHVRAAFDRVVRGQILAELYIPEWIAAQEEFLSVRRMRGVDLGGLIDGARQRMRQVGMSEAQVALVETTGRTQPRIALTAPIGGVVTELMVREGMTVMSGAAMFRINGLGTIWAEAELPESQAALVRPGARVEAKSPAVPGTTFAGRVQAILPRIDAATRTIRVRLELANPGARLVPGMSVQMQFMDPRPGKVLLVPTEAIIQTGRRTVVMLAEEDGRFRPVDVEIGIESGDQTEVRRGLQSGQRVVVSSQFLIDSEASLKGVEARLNAAPPPGAAVSTQRHEGDARVEAIGRDAITLSHGPIASLKWPSMTMDFKPPSNGLPRGLATGDKVNFEFYLEPDGVPRLTAMSPVAPTASTPSSQAQPKPKPTPAPTPAPTPPRPSPQLPMGPGGAP